MCQCLCLCRLIHPRLCKLLVIMLTTEARVGAVGRAAFPMRPTNQSWSMHPRSSSRNASKNQRMRTPPSPTLGTSDGVNSSVETSLKTIELPDVHARKRTQNLETISTSNHTTREENELKDLSTSPIKLTTDRKIQEMLDDAQRNSRQLKKRYVSVTPGVESQQELGFLADFWLTKCDP